MEATTQKKKAKTESLSIRDVLYLFLSNWYWYVISLAVCIGIAIWIIMTTTPQYTRTASILIKDGSASSTDGVTDAFSDLSVFNTTINISNELEALHTPDLVQEVVSRLDLDVDYQVPGKFHPLTVYGASLPVKVEFEDVPNDQSASLEMKLSPDGTYILSDFVLCGVPQESRPIKCEIGKTINSPLGKLKITAGKGQPYKDTYTLEITKSPIKAVTASYNARLGVAQKSEKTSIINLTFSDVSIERADDFLNGVIAVYNENWVSDKNQIAVSTSMFINDRLAVIENELGDVDDDISSYKSANLLPDVSAAASMAMSQASEANSGIKELSNQAYMARFVRNYLSNSGNTNELIPVNSGIDNLNIATQIDQYNSILMERNSLLAHTSDKNPLIQEMDRNLAMMRSSLISSIDNQIMVIDEQIKTLRSTSGAATSQIASNPQQAKYLLNVERQQKVKESLYLYLLQKREENELSQAFTAYNTTVMMLPTGSNAPTTPQKGRILIIAIIIGLAIPTAIIVIKEMSNTTVRGRRDIETLSAPFLGEIPQVGKPKKRKKDKSRENDIVVHKDNRNSINEAFRVVRTNLEFMTGKHNDGTVIAITSANPASGKTFVTYNLALSLAIKGKKVIAIDLDLRRSSLSRFVNKPNIGVSNFLAGQTDYINDIIVKSDGDDKIDIIPVGAIPPNPTELLFSNRLTELIHTLKRYYDYIFLDCPPVEIVADASIINLVADETIFIIRAGILDRGMVEDIEAYYTEKKYKNMCILLNGTDGGSSKYGSKYGYRYGYKYGYRYGYESNK